MNKKEPSGQTKQRVYQRWKGKCAFCGIDLPIEQHHIIAISEDPNLIDDPDNLIIVCSNHHSLTQKKKPNGIPAISFLDIQDLKRSKYVEADKNGFYFNIPQNFVINLGNNTCVNCPYILVINGKPLIEIWPQEPAHYSGEKRFYLYMRFFDEDNNFIGGMFANHWASVVNEEWSLKISETTIETSHKTKSIFVKFDKTSILTITGNFYFDGIKIEAKEKELVLPIGNRFINNSIYNSEVAFNISGDRKGASIGIGGSLSPNLNLRN